MPSLQSDLQIVPGPQSASPRGEAEDLGGELKGTEEFQKVQLVEKPKPEGEEGEWLRGGRGLGLGLWGGEAAHRDEEQE